MFIQEHSHVDTLIKSYVGAGTKRVPSEEVHEVEGDKLPNKL